MVRRPRCPSWRISERIQSQQAERVRIARELHDTLLQGVSSLSLTVHSALNKVDQDHPVAPLLASGLRQAETVIAEGRERVVRLRADAAGGDTLIDDMGLLRLELTDGGTSRFALTVKGEARPLAPQVVEECRSVVREAIWNAVQHANADHITLSVDFGWRMLTLQVRDDGAGLPAALLAAGGREGHWGLPGMRERACRIGGRLNSSSSGGTLVTLSVPASLAYKKC